ncbi:MAG: hypothetical protein ACHQFW_12000 [Chitinophagales bacterium]
MIKIYGVPKFCKIDVEGYESKVFEGLETNIRFICFEFNRLLLTDTKKCFEQLQRLGNYRCNFIQYEKMDLMLNEWITTAEFNSKIEKLIPLEILTGEIIAEHVG